ncbi:MAG: nitrous oxide-stimulated promoter family protein [Candidatus Hermodarchaeota archaeon]
MNPISRLEKERNTIRTMIQMYCKNCHKSDKSLCEECSDLYSYAEERLKNCKFGEEKPTCDTCPIHCYKPDMRKKIRVVMRYAGPRMVYTHPIMGIRHLFKKLKKRKTNDKKK